MREKFQHSVIYFFLLFNIIIYSQNADYTNRSLKIDDRVQDLLSRMSVDEKVAQMRIFHANKGVELSNSDQIVLPDNVKQRLKFGIAGIKNPGEHLDPIRAAKLNNQLQKYIMDNNRWGIPALFITESYNGVDAEGCTKFGRPLTTAASFNPDLVNEIWDVVGREARFRGMHMCHSPEADIVRDPRFGRMSEAFGEDTYLTTQMVTNAVTGVQGDYTGLGNGTHIGAVTKHFAGYGQVLGGTNFAAIEISERTLIDEIFPPFEAAVKEGRSLGVMASHGDLNGIASHSNPWLLTDVLREQWGFEGYTVSDANDIARLHFFMNVAETPEDAAILALEAGMDVDLYSDEAYALLPKLVETKPELLKHIDRAAGHVLRTKFILGLFDDPFVDIDEVKNNVRTEEALKLAQKADLESIILLKNKSSTLPLKDNAPVTVALVGPLLYESTLDDFKKVAGSEYQFIAEKGFQLTNEKSSVPRLLDRADQNLEACVDAVKKADIAILFLGGDNFTSKEAFFKNALGDRATIDPVGPQDELVKEIKALQKPIIVVLRHRRTLSINVISNEADAILDTWDLSEFADQSIAKIIFGKAVPSGKLPVTVPRSIGQLPFHYSMKSINSKKEYLFLQKGPFYPFGFGLSYTEFEYSNLKLSRDQMSCTGSLNVSVDLKNSGKYKAKEVVQLYVRDEIGSVTRPEKELKAFDKVELSPGEMKTISFQITPDMLEFTGLNMKKGFEPGGYTIMVGSSSQTYLTAKFKLTKE